MPPLIKNTPLKLGARFGLIHGGVDFVTVSVAFAVSRIYGHPYVYGLSVIVLYDIVAFAGQALIGHLSDRTRTYKTVALVGIGLTASSVPLVSLSPLAAAVTTALGNACFHVGGGALVLRVSPGRAAAPGVFVAPGAIGLGIATMLSKSRIFLPWPMIGLMALCVIAVVLSRVPDTRVIGEGRPAVKRPYLIVTLLLASVAIRALVGFGGAHNCTKTFGVKVALMVVAFLGKGLGGILCDKIGWIRGSIGALLLSLPLIAFLGHLPVTLIAGFVLFQMTMPITLVSVERIMPNRPGLAFGLCSLALVLGSLAAFSSDVRAVYSDGLFAGLIAASAVMLYISLKQLSPYVQMKF